MCSFVPEYSILPSVPSILIARDAQNSVTYHVQLPSIRLVTRCLGAYDAAGFRSS